MTLHKKTLFLLENAKKELEKHEKIINTLAIKKKQTKKYFYHREIYFYWMGFTKAIKTIYPSLAAKK